MKKNVILVGLLCLSLMAFNSCKDKDKGKDEETMSKLSVEQHKSNLQNEGVAFVEDMSAMENMSTLQIIQDFSNLEINDDQMTAPISKVLKPLLTLKSNGAAAIQLKSLSTESQTLSGLFAENSGIYTYNSETMEWVVTESTNEITFIFPVGSSTTNNASISFSDFEYTESPNAENSSEEFSELVESLKIEIKKDQVQQFLFDMSASYNADGLPENSSIVFSFVEGYVFSTTTSLTNKIANFDQSFSYNGKQLYASHLDLNGNLNYDEIINASEEETDIYEQTILNSANAWFSINNIKFQGVANVSGLKDAVGKIDDSQNQEKVAQSVAAAFNSNLKFYVKYKDSDEIIAKNEFYAREYTDDMQNSYWDLSQRIIFSDKSAMDESFFDSGFDNLQTAIQEWADAMDANYGE